MMIDEIINRIQSIKKNEKNLIKLSCACHTHRHMHHNTLPMSWLYSENKLQLWFWNEMCVANYSSAQFSASPETNQILSATVLERLFYHALVVH